MKDLSNYSNRVGDKVICNKGDDVFEGQISEIVPEMQYTVILRDGSERCIDQSNIVSTFSRMRYVIKNSCGPEDISYYSNSDYSMVWNIQYATRYIIYPHSDYEFVCENNGGFTEVIKVEQIESSYRLIEPTQTT